MDNWYDYSQLIWENKIDGNQTTNQIIFIDPGDFSNFLAILFFFRARAWKRCQQETGAAKKMGGFPYVVPQERWMVKENLTTGDLDVVAPFSDNPRNLRVNSCE